MIGERIYSGLWSEDAAGYARELVIDPPYVFVSGTTGFDPETKSFPESVEEQTENCFRTIEAALKEGRNRSLQSAARPHFRDQQRRV